MAAALELRRACQGVTTAKHRTPQKYLVFSCVPSIYLCYSNKFCRECVTIISNEDEERSRARNGAHSGKCNVAVQALRRTYAAQITQRRNAPHAVHALKSCTHLCLRSMRSYCWIMVLLEVLYHAARPASLRCLATVAVVLSSSRICQCSDCH